MQDLNQPNLLRKGMLDHKHLKQQNNHPVARDILYLLWQHPETRNNQLKVTNLQPAHHQQLQPLLKVLHHVAGLHSHPLKDINLHVIHQHQLNLLVVEPNRPLQKDTNPHVIHLHQLQSQLPLPPVEDNLHLLKDTSLHVILRQQLKLHHHVEDNPSHLLRDTNHHVLNQPQLDRHVPVD